FLPPSKTINSEFYRQQLMRLEQEVEKKPSKCESDSRTEGSVQICSSVAQQNPYLLQARRKAFFKLVAHKDRVTPTARRERTARDVSRTRASRPSLRPVESKMFVGKRNNNASEKPVKVKRWSRGGGRRAARRALRACTLHAACFRVRFRGLVLESNKWKDIESPIN
ncbi:hypothetical protein EVAR_99972_1, partial [Eumeta japonica]